MWFPVVTIVTIALECTVIELAVWDRQTIAAFLNAVCVWAS